MRWKCRCRTRASPSPWTCAAHSWAPVIKDIFMPLKTFSSNVTNALSVKRPEQPRWGLPSPRLLSWSFQRDEGALLGGVKEGLGNEGNAGHRAEWKAPSMRLLSNRSCLVLDSFVQPESWLPRWYWETELGNYPCDFLPASLIWVITVMYISRILPLLLYGPGGSVNKESACSVGDLAVIPESGRSPGEGNGYPLQYYWLENP